MVNLLWQLPSRAAAILSRRSVAKYHQHQSRIHLNHSKRLGLPILSVTAYRDPQHDALLSMTTAIKFYLRLISIEGPPPVAGGRRQAVPIPGRTGQTRRCDRGDTVRTQLSSGWLLMEKSRRTHRHEYASLRSTRFERSMLKRQKDRRGVVGEERGAATVFVFLHLVSVMHWCLAFLLFHISACFPMPILIRACLALSLFFL